MLQLVAVGWTTKSLVRGWRGIPSNINWGGGNSMAIQKGLDVRETSRDVGDVWSGQGGAAKA